MPFEDLPPGTRDFLRQRAVCINPLGLQTSDRVSVGGYIDIFTHDFHMQTLRISEYVRSSSCTGRFMEKAVMES